MCCCVGRTFGVDGIGEVVDDVTKRGLSKFVGVETAVGGDRIETTGFKIGITCTLVVVGVSRFVCTRLPEAISPPLDLRSKCL